MRAAIYGRNSAAKAKSISDQLKLGHLAVKEHGWTTAGEYSDKTKASKYRTKDRKNWPTLVADLTDGSIDVLVIWNVARGTRDELDWFPLLRICEERGVLVHVIGHKRTYDPRISRDWKTLAEEGVAAAHYSRELSENVSRGILLSATNEEGAGPHGRPAYGYDVEYDPITKRPRRVLNQKAPIVLEIFAKLDKRTPVSVVTDGLNDADVPAPHGGRWERKTVRIIATNLAYIGKRRFRGEIYSAQWEPLVEEAAFWRVQAFLAEPSRMKTRPGRYVYLLSWLTETPCGGRLRGHPEKNRPLRYICERDACVSIQADEADEAVTRALLARLQRPDARRALTRQGEIAATAAVEAARYRSQLEEARQSFEQPDGISAVALARKERALLPLIADAESRSQAAPGGNVVDLLLAAEDVPAVWADLSVAARRNVLSAFARVRVGRATRRLGNHAGREQRLYEAIARLGKSQWHDSDQTWSGLATGEQG